MAAEHGERGDVHVKQLLSFLRRNDAFGKNLGGLLPKVVQTVAARLWRRSYAKHQVRPLVLSKTGELT